MTKQKIIKLKKIKIFIKKLSKKLAKKAFLTFLGLFALSLIFGSFIFYRYSVMPQSEAVEDVKVELKFKSETYQKILQAWQNNEEQFEKTDDKQYFNFFIR